MTEHRNLTYKAEHAVWGGKKARRFSEPLSSFRTREVMDSLGLSSWGLKRVQGYGGACRKQKRLITIGRHAPEWIVYHEMAHALADTHGHDARFRGAYLFVVREQLGDYWAQRLEIAFRREKLAVAEFVPV